MSISRVDVDDDYCPDACVECDKPKAKIMCDVCGVGPFCRGCMDDHMEDEHKDHMDVTLDLYRRH